MSVYLVQKPFFLSHLETAILAPINTPLKLSASWRGARGRLSVWRMHCRFPHHAHPYSPKAWAERGIPGCSHRVGFHCGSLCAGATGRDSALGHGVCPSFEHLKMHSSHEAPGRAKQLKESNSRDESIHEKWAFPEVSALDSRVLEGRASPDSLHSAFTKLYKCLWHKI